MLNIERSTGPNFIGISLCKKQSLIFSKVLHLPCLLNLFIEYLLYFFRNGFLQNNRISLSNQQFKNNTDPGHLTVEAVCERGVMLLHDGFLVFSGSLQKLLAYFSASAPGEVFRILRTKPASE
ncbi:MAG: hypothetical protein MJK04_19765, partial [Psychrosphaera sp.]|nr:hypothetical protein [Psychrosphaera sp.]